MNTERWRELGTAYSLATLWFIVPLKELLYPGTDYYHVFKAHTAFEYLAVFADVLLLSLSFALLLAWIRRTKGTRLSFVLQCIFVFLAVIAFGPLSYELMKWLSPESRSWLVSLPLPTVVLIASVWFTNRQGFGVTRVADNLKIAALLLLPFSLLVVLQGLRDEFLFDEESLSPAYVESPSIVPLMKKRVVWIIFDELGYASLSTASRNKTNVGDIETLMSESFVAHNAHSPNTNTMESIPALLTGRSIKKARPESSRDLLLYPTNGDRPFSLRESENVFTDVRALGGTSAIVGWYHPYSRLFDGDVSYCYWSPQAVPDCSGMAGFAACEARLFIRSLERLPLAQHILPEMLWTAEDVLRDEDSATQLSRHKFLLTKSEDLLPRSDVNLFFIHFSIPHYPAISLETARGPSNYFTSLEVVNDAVRRLRETLERSGKWNDTVLIISSDHLWRVKSLADFDYLPAEEGEAALEDERIPFIVRFPGQSSRVDIDLEFNTVVSRSMIREIVADKIRSPNDLKQWLEDSVASANGSSLVTRRNVGR
jgi:hypothetical protein